MNNFPKLAIIYLSYHSDPYFSDMVSSLERSTYPKDKMALVIVDNPHPQYGSSVEKINELVVPKSGKTIPEVVLLPQEKNLGFSGGNNAGTEWAIENGYEYFFLHNQDGYVAPDCFEKMILAMETDRKIGCAQALIMLHDQKDRINSAGNTFNYLGFGFINNFGKKLSELKLSAVEEIGYASGAGLIMRKDLVEKYGALDVDLFAYHEDVEYSLRLKAAGYKIALIKDAVFYHKYVFNRSPSKFYLMERNRYAVLLLYYSYPTLFLLLPMLLLMEMGLLAFFISQGWWKEKLDVYRYWLKVSSWSLWLKKRKSIQLIKQIKDRQIIKLASNVVYFGEKKEMNNPFLLYIANPLMVVYRAILLLLIHW